MAHGNAMAVAILAHAGGGTAKPASLSTMMGTARALNVMRRRKKEALYRLEAGALPPPRAPNSTRRTSARVSTVQGFVRGVT